ncbi:MAG: 6-carboxytetrahydropterin synthase QueD [Bacteroidales bacterium]|nr:6-carboxytetrahydropterin synthase QueD [Bacteroidales bacterium]
MLIRLTKELEFQMAHSLTGYDGKCRNIHGHNYRLQVTVEGEPIQNATDAKNGMVADFGDIKRIVQQYVVDVFDHAFVVPEGSPFAGVGETNLIVTPFQPTSENLLIHFASLLEGRFPDRVRLHSLRLWETATSCAELIL